MLEESWKKSWKKGITSFILTENCWRFKIENLFHNPCVVAKQLWYKNIRKLSPDMTTSPFEKNNWIFITIKGVVTIFNILLIMICLIILDWTKFHQNVRAFQQMHLYLVIAWKYYFFLVYQKKYLFIEL